ncbi:MULTISPECIES: efflux transporter outer membrane subunit [unclassified Sphingomonas]|uniref:efflux transporter outer membrane subunit n=1 Tax=unclassified Sphingomonas TaxID=196159 RepID=UPI0008299B74|nr:MULTISPECIES: efflux transporter outer membrane subunit [unclassified Sphingomonas]
MSRRHLLSGLSATALALAACAPVERPPAPGSIALPDAFALLDRQASASGTLPDLLPSQDPAFVALNARAMADAPELAIAVARIDAARAGLRGAGAERLPNITAGGDGSRRRISAAQFAGLPDGIEIQRYVSNFSASADASWDIDLFGRLRAGQRAAAARLDAATADAAAVRLALATDIARAVLDYRDLAGRTALVRDDLASADALAEVTGVRARAGIVPGFDLVRAQSLAAEAQSRLDAIAGERAAIIGRLVTLTGAPADTILAALEPAQPVPAITPGLPTLEVPSVLLRRRPDVAAAERRLAAADADIAAAAAERFPTFSITGSIGLLALAFGDLFNEEAITGSLGGSIAGPLLDFGRIGARIDQREAEAREAFATYRRALFTALGETEAALGALDAAAKRAGALSRQAELDRDAAQLARERYRRGLDTFLTVLDAERTSYASRQSAITAQAEVARARVALYRAVGGEG